MRSSAASICTANIREKPGHRTAEEQLDRDAVSERMLCI